MQSTDSGSLTAIILLAIPLLIGVAALLFAILTWRGRRLDDHPLCRACGFDLFGSPEPREKCPECGADVSRSSAIRIGNRKRRKGLAVATILVALLCVAILGFYGYAKSAQMNFNPYKPVWLLRWEATTPGMSSGGAFAELLRRTRSNRLTIGQDKALMSDLLVIQSNPTFPWNDDCRDMFRILQGKGASTSAKYEQFAINAFDWRFEPRQRVRQNEWIPIAIDLRSDRGLDQIRNGLWIEQSKTVVAIADQRQQLDWMDEILVDEGFMGSASLIRIHMDDLPLGPQIVNYETHLEVRLGDETGPLLASFVMSQSAAFEVIPPDSQEIAFVSEPAAGPILEKAISVEDHEVRIEPDDNYDRVSMGIRIFNLAYPIGYDLILQVDDREWFAGRLAYPGQDEPTSTPLVDNVISHIKGGLPNDVTIVDVVFRPSADAARQTIDVFEIVDHEFVIEDVTIERKSDEPRP